MVEGNEAKMMIRENRKCERKNNYIRVVIKGRFVKKEKKIGYEFIFNTVYLNLYYA